MAKLLLLQLLLAFVVTVSGITYHLPSGCSLPNCLYIANVTIDKSGGISVVVNATQSKPGQTWTGMGFSKESNTKHVDLVYGGSFNGKAIHVHGIHETGKKIIPLPPLPNKELTEVSGRLILKFTHPAHGLNSKDFSFPDNACYYLVFPTENGKMLDDKGTVSLESSKIHFSETPVCVKDLKTPETTIPPSTVFSKQGGDDVVFKPEGEEVYPPNCMAGSCVYKFTWKLDMSKKVVNFHLESKQGENTYVGVGLTSSRNHKDIIFATLGYKNSVGKYVVTTGRFPAGSLTPTITDIQEMLVNPTLTYKNGRWIMDCGVKLETRRTDTINLMKHAYFLVSLVEGGPVKKPNQLGPLTMKELPYSSTKIRVVNPETTTLSPHNLGDVIVEPRGEAGIPHECQGPTCLYHVKWELVENGKVARYTVTAKQTKNTYIAFGFSSERNTKEIYAVFGYMKKSDEVVVKGKIHGNAKPQLSDNSGLENTKLTYAGGLYTLVFEISLEETGDFVNLTEPYYYVLMQDGGPVISDNNLGPLVKKLPQFTDKKISLVEQGGVSVATSEMESPEHRRVTLTTSEMESPEHHTPEHLLVSGKHETATHHIRETGTQGTEITEATPMGLDDDTEATEAPREDLLPIRTKVRFCNFANWAQHYPSPVKFLPSDIDPTLCTHINYCFVWVHNRTLIPTENNDEGDEVKKGLMQKINDLKKDNPALKTILSVGGYDMKIERLTEMLKDKESRTDFIENSIAYLRWFGFDGINLMFKYPGWGASPPEDKDRFMELVKEMKTEFTAEMENSGKKRLQLVVSVSVLPEIIARSYDVQTLSKSADIIQLLAYDLHGGWEKKAFHHAPLKASSNSGSLGMERAVSTWTSLGADRQKLIIGIPLYGRGGILKDRTVSIPGSPIVKPSPPGLYTKTPGLLAYYEICPILKMSITKRHWIQEESVPYFVSNSTWMGYDDEMSVHYKAKWIIDNKLLGASTWITNFDDFKGSFCNRGRYPLIRTVSDTLLGKTIKTFDG